MMRNILYDFRSRLCPVFGVSLLAFIWVLPGHQTFGLTIQSTESLQQESGESAPSSPTQSVWLDIDGKPLPFQTDQEIQEFLRTASVVSIQKIPVGVTKPKQVLLEKDGIRMHAKFNNVKVDKPRIKMKSGTVKFNFRDDAIFNCAAYELSKLLGLDNVPPVVERKIKGQGKKGILQAWVEKGMVETERLKNKIEAPNKWRWTMQYQVMRLFDNLIYNEDPNQGNILYDQDWKLWMIDHTRAFRTYSEPLNPTTIRFVERNCWEKLQKLNQKTLDERLKPFLRSREIKAILKRRDKLVEHVQNMIDKRGEGKVLFTFY
ncbi:hypothetical protein MYX75_08035 [Acidobacteria bacterium AH-259-A15]|nr:hypothetical protein [Acidobacteria bacterium AH-259-A15]